MESYLLTLFVFAGLVYTIKGIFNRKTYISSWGPFSGTPAVMVGILTFCLITIFIVSMPHLFKINSIFSDPLIIVIILLSAPIGNWWYNLIDQGPRYSGYINSFRSWAAIIYTSLLIIVLIALLYSVYKLNTI